MENFIFFFFFFYSYFHSLFNKYLLHALRLHFHFSLSCIGEGNGNPLQCSCLDDPRDARAWWAAVYGVAQSRTWLKRLSSSIQQALCWILRKELMLCQNISKLRKLHSPVLEARMEGVDGWWWLLLNKWPLSQGPYCFML